MGDRAEKHIAIRQVASFLAPLKVQWAILVGEAWWIPLEEARPDRPHAAHASNRREGIALDGVTSDGRACNRRVDFSRRGDEIVFGEEHGDSKLANIMIPIRDAISLS